MYIDSRLERSVLVQTAELYTPGKYVNWILNFINGGPTLAMENQREVFALQTVLHGGDRHAVPLEVDPLILSLVRILQHASKLCDQEGHLL